MGMAAGQARLLSITSRMSDNELRAQIINNNKMRLATQSSQVSEAYVAALNDAQLMFTSYDSDNNASYQQLTFNALTAYNPYNNQYILTNSSGNVLLSEDDAKKYEASSNVTEFLEQYGLEQTTTYFDNLTQHYVAKGSDLDNPEAWGIVYKTGLTDINGNEMVGYIQCPSTNEAVTGADVSAYIQALYEGTLTDTYEKDGVTTNLHPGYMNAIASEDYYDYTRALGNFTTAYDAYLECTAQLMKEKLEQIYVGQIGGDYKVDTGEKNDSFDLSAYKTAISATTKVSDMTDIFTSLSKVITEAEKLATTESGKSYFENLKEIIKNNSSTLVSTTISSSDGYTFTKSGGTITVTEDGETVLTLTSTGGTAYDEDDVNGISLTQGTDGSNNYTYTYTTTKTGSNGNKYDYTETYTVPASWFTSTETTLTGDITVQYTNDVENMQSVALQIISSLSTAIYSVWDPTNSDFVPSDTSDYGYNEYQTFLDAGKELSETIFGKDVGKENYANLLDIETVYNTMASDFQGNKRNDFTKIYDVYLLDCILDTYGEPNYTWIDKENQNNNGETKAQWYENLYERIQSGGYTVLKDGLASSTEWIQFAFESGIVTMEQVDSNQNWQSLSYSNCSDITEQTDSAAIAIAEAEYNAAMNKIENKDKRYDLELKNIDTEHNSLQTEYDSIKTAIDKNIERTFKLYS